MTRDCCRWMLMPAVVEIVQPTTIDIMDIGEKIHQEGTVPVTSPDYRVL